MKTFELHAITNGIESIDEFIKAALLTAPHVTHIHIREKDRSALDLYCLVKKMKEQGIQDKTIVVNDRADVAIAAGANGVHLKETSLQPHVVNHHFPALRIGRSVHSREEAEEAERNGAHYLFYGHVFETNSKRGAEPRGVEKLKEVADAVSIPVIAIGGITPLNAMEAIRAGAAGVAVMSGIWSAARPDFAAAEYAKALMEGVRTNEETV